MLAAGWERLEGRAVAVRLESESYQATTYYHALLELLLGYLAVIVDIPLRSGTQSQQGCCR